MCTELEIIMLDWVGQMIGLPEQFLCFADPNSKGGGVIQVSSISVHSVCFVGTSISLIFILIFILGLCQRLCAGLSTGRPLCRPEGAEEGGTGGG